MAFMVEIQIPFYAFAELSYVQISQWELKLQGRGVAMEAFRKDR